MSFAALRPDLEAFNITEPASRAQNGTTKTLPSDEPPSMGLSNAIHPIWSYARFKQKVVYEKLPALITDNMIPEDIDDLREEGSAETVIPPIGKAAYDRMKPALRLASILLKKSLYFLYNVRNANIVETEVQYGQNRIVRPHFDKLPPEQFRVSHEQLILQQLEDISKRMYFIGHISSKDMACIAMAMMWHQRLTRTPGRRPTGGVRKTLNQRRVTGLKSNARICGCPMDQTCTCAQSQPHCPPLSLPGCVPVKPPRWHSRTRAATEISPVSPKKSVQQHSHDLRPRNQEPSVLSFIVCLPAELVGLLTPPSPGSGEPDFWLQLPREAQYRVLLCLAITLVHELVHTTFHARAFSNRAATYEAYFNPETDTENELGFAWESWFFGGFLCPVDGEIGGGGDKVLIETTSPPGHTGVRLPTYAFGWRKPRHYQAPVQARAGMDGRLSWQVKRDVGTQFFQKHIAAPWERATSTGTNLDRKQDSPLSTSTAPSQQEDTVKPPVVYLTPYVINYPDYYWAGRGIEHRGRKRREHVWRRFDEWLRLCYTTGVAPAAATPQWTTEPGWRFSWDSVYQDNVRSPSVGQSSPSLEDGSDNENSDGGMIATLSGVEINTRYLDEYNAAGGEEQGTVGALEPPPEDFLARAMGLDPFAGGKPSGVPELELGTKGSAEPSHPQSRIRPGRANRQRKRSRRAVKTEGLWDDFVLGLPPPKRVKFTKGLSLKLEERTK